MGSYLRFLDEEKDIDPGLLESILSNYEETKGHGIELYLFVPQCLFAGCRVENIPDQSVQTLLDPYQIAIHARRSDPRYTINSMAPHLKKMVHLYKECQELDSLRHLLYMMSITCNPVNIVNLIQCIPMIEMEVLKGALSKYQPVWATIRTQKDFIFELRTLMVQNTFRILGEGGYGTVYRPPLPCDDKKPCPRNIRECRTGVSKLLNRINWKQEIEKYHQLGMDTIDPDHKFHVKHIHSCKLHESAISSIHKKKNHLHKDRIYSIVYEFGGESLTSILQRRTSTRASILRGLYKIILGLKLMHSNFIYHLDIKPDNIICAHETYRLIDFGLSIKLSPGEVAMLHHCYSRPYIWPIEINYFTPNPKTPESILQTYLSSGKLRYPSSRYKRTMEKLNPVLKSIRSRNYYSTEENKALSQYAFSKIDIFQMGLILSRKQLLGTSHPLVLRMLDPDPDHRIDIISLQENYSKLL
jgi:hypothetical protein